MTPIQIQSEKLKEYSKKFLVNDSIWKFVTGNKFDLYSIAQNHYRVNSVEKINTENELPDFIHSTKIILIDKDKRIRGKGWYDSFDMNEILQLIDDIKILLKEYHDLENK